jgi:hypothetical protein
LGVFEALISEFDTHFDIFESARQPTYSSSRHGLALQEEMATKYNDRDQPAWFGVCWRARELTHIAQQQACSIEEPIARPTKYYATNPARFAGARGR